MAIREDTIGQSIFMNSADMVPKDHISRLVAIVDEIDVSKAEEKFIGTPGHPVVTLLMLFCTPDLLKIWLVRIPRLN